MATPMPRTITFQADSGNGQATVLPHLEQQGPLMQYLQTPPPKTSTATIGTTSKQSPKELDKEFGNTKFIFEVGRDRDFSTSSWAGKGLFRSIWKNPALLTGEDGGPLKSTMAAYMRDCEIIVRLAENDPKQPETPAALNEIFKYFADVLTLDEGYFETDGEEEEEDGGEKTGRYPGIGYSLQRLTVRFLWGSSDWDTLGDVPSSCQHALEPLIGLQKVLSTLELEGVNEPFAGRFARGLAEPEEVNFKYAGGTFILEQYKPISKEMIRKGEAEFDWEDGEEPLSGRKTLRQTLTFNVGADRES